MNKLGYVNCVEWKLFDLKDWIENFEILVNQVVNVFVYKCKYFKNLIIKDICDMILFFENCFYFGFNEKNKILRDVCGIRNIYFVYNFLYIMEENNL